MNEGKAWRQCQHVCCDSQWPWQQGPTTVTVRSRNITTAQSWTKVSVHNFERKGAVSRKNHLENSSFMWFVSGSVYCLEVPQKHSPVLQHSAPKVAGGFGSGKQRGDSHLAHTLPTCSCRQASLSSLLLPLAVFSKECWNFMSSCSIHPLFTKFHMLLPLSSHLNCTILKEWSLFSDFLKNEVLSWGWRSQANTEDNETSLPEKCVLFFYLSRKGLLLYEEDELLSLPIYSLILPGQHQDAHSPDTDSSFPAMGSSPLRTSANPHSSTGPEAWPRQIHQQGSKRNDAQNSGHNAGEEVGWGGLGLQLQLQEEGKGHWVGVLIQGAADTFDVTTSSQSSEPHLSAAQGSRKIK